MRVTDHTYTPKELLNELHALVGEAETMLVSAGSECSAEVLATLRTRFAAVRERVGELYYEAKDRVVAGARHTDATIRANPYQSLAIAAGVGLLVGVLVGRRTR